MVSGAVAHAWNPALRRQREEDCKFQTSLDYAVRPCQKKKKKRKNERKRAGRVTQQVAKSTCLASMRQTPVLQK
jgi:hypothetical protein